MRMLPAVLASCSWALVGCNVCVCVCAACPATFYTVNLPSALLPHPAMDHSTPHPHGHCRTVDCMCCGNCVLFQLCACACMCCGCCAAHSHSPCCVLHLLSVVCMWSGCLSSCRQLLVAGMCCGYPLLHACAVIAPLVECMCCVFLHS